MRVLLVSSNVAVTPYPVYPLGMSMVAAAARLDGHEVAFFDFLQNSMSISALTERLRNFRPAVVGVSIRNVDNVNLMHEERYLDSVATIVECVGRQTGAKTVLGGTAFSIFPELILTRTGADYGIVGEGEALFRQLLAAGERGRWPERGAIWRSQSRLQGTAIPSALYDADILAHYLREGSVASIQSKRGCPLDCVYCSYPALEGRKLRLRPPSEVVDDIERLVDEHQVDSFFFTDSVFNDDQGAYLEVLGEMRRRRLEIPWSAFFKPSGVTRKVVELLKSAGLRSVELGSDAATEATLRGQKKSFSWSDVKAANQLFMEAGIPAAHYFMFGGPGETEETVRDGIKNIMDLPCTVAFVFMGVRILPRTELYQLALREGLAAPDNNLLEPIYYISPKVDRQWLEYTLTQAFADSRRIMFPPDRFDQHLRMLHKMGYNGSLWELLGIESVRKKRAERMKTGTAAGQMP